MSVLYPGGNIREPAAPPENRNGPTKKSVASEPSALMFSNEVSVGNGKVFRRFYRPASGKIAKPMVPYFDPAGAGDAYAVAITDPTATLQIVQLARSLNPGAAILARTRYVLDVDRLLDGDGHRLAILLSGLVAPLADGLGRGLRGPDRPGRLQCLQRWSGRHDAAHRPGPGPPGHQG